MTNSTFHRIHHAHVLCSEASRTVIPGSPAHLAQMDRKQRPRDSNKRSKHVKVSK